MVKSIIGALSSDEIEPFAKALSSISSFFKAYDNVINYVNEDNIKGM
ncbi:MAG: hypothetical protein LBS74_08280 [Oscillospiraceae bacterium]|jgi:hypothetical protein|nr:hypothetical protein [Oscillospiraceae bacterium]